VRGSGMMHTWMGWRQHTVDVRCAPATTQMCALSRGKAPPRTAGTLRGDERGSAGEGRRHPSERATAAARSGGEGGGRQRGECPPHISGGAGHVCPPPLMGGGTPVAGLPGHLSPDPRRRRATCGEGGGEAARAPRPPRCRTHSTTRPASTHCSNPLGPGEGQVRAGDEEEGAGRGRRGGGHADATSHMTTMCACNVQGGSE
jgi:hypothetical protein